METTYQIWDNDTFNIVYAYPTLDEALADVRDEISANGPESVSSWVLQYDDRTRIKNIAYGDGLVRLATETSPATVHD